MPGSAALVCNWGCSLWYWKAFGSNNETCIPFHWTICPEATFIYDNPFSHGQHNVFKHCDWTWTHIQMKNWKILFKILLKQPIPVILDAGALSPRTYEKRLGHSTILTPHPGEFSRLTGKIAKRFKVIGFN